MPHLRLPQPITRPRPLGQKIRVNAILKRLVPRLDLPVQQILPRGRAAIVQARNPIDGVHREAEAVRLVPDGQLERGVDISLLRVPAHVQVAVRARPLVRQAVHEPGVAVEVEDDGPVGREEGGPLAVREPVRVVLVRDELEQVDAVDAADPEVREVLQEQVDGGEGLVRADVAAARHDQVRLGARVRRELRPDTDALCAVLDGGLHRQVLQVVLLVGDDDVDVVGRPEAVVHARQQAVAVGREVDADDFGGLVGYHVEEARVLVGEAVVVLAPDDCGQEDVEGGHLDAPFDFEAFLDPFAVLKTF